MLKKRNFTLVEIMIVVAIIGILVSAAVFGFQKYRNTSRVRACVSNLKTIDTATQSYISDKNIGAFDSDVAGLLAAGYLKYNPVCSEGGTYSIDLTAGADVNCSVGGLHVLP